MSRMNQFIHSFYLQESSRNTDVQEHMMSVNGKAFLTSKAISKTPEEKLLIRH